AYPTAAHFRRLLQAKLPLFLRQMPASDPLAALAGKPAAVVPALVSSRWPAVDPARIDLSGLLIDHRVPPVAMRGGATAAVARLRDFLAADVVAYGQVRNQPDDDRTSRLSPWLHFGHLSAHQALAETLEHARWSPDRLATRSTGAKEGWWGIDAGSESFIDELIIWRELGFVFADHVPGYDQWDSLPPWARATLDLHAGDPRPQLYALEQFANAATHDPLWNAAQTQLLREGRIHNYLRMLWGKKILEWSSSPRAALEIMIELNNRWAVDGRDPNSYSGIFWCLGRFDRPWPEREIFGKIRWMSSQNTAKKLDVQGYIARYALA
ncbi:MAG: deoxyribodipyrimidine photolyase, partial [Planctomycetes bacterium]|nr:deoxyribodipyrimidine photolyase [Planctomycetota bacterium]